MFVLSAATNMPGESREPFLVINKYVRQEPELLLNIPPTEETRVRASRLPSSSTQDVETPMET
jgi:hypothetical protein